MSHAPATLQVPFIDLARQHAEQQEALEQALLTTFRTGAYCNGPTVQAFERACQTYLAPEGGLTALACASGTDALVLALQALGAGPGTKVITPTFSFFASASAISLNGATPVFADIDPTSYCLSRKTLEAAWQSGVVGIIVVHLYGHPAPLDEILAFASEKGIWVLEDTAQSFGARYRGQAVGTVGRAGAVSFYPTKNLNACGDAGLMTTTDPALAETLRLLRAHGEQPRYTHTILGRNSRMDDLQAAVLGVKLERLDHWNARRRDIAATYSAAFADLPLVTPPGPAAGIEPIFHQYTIATQQRDALRQHLTDLGIGCGVYYPVPLHMQPLYAGSGVAPESLPNAYRLAQEVLSLPIFPQLTPAEIEAVIAGVRSFYGC